MKNCKLLAIVFCFVFFSANEDSKAQTACTMTVAQDGSGNYTTIQAAANAAAAGNVVCVKAGNYNEQVFFKKSGTASAGYITFQNFGTDIVTTTPPSSGSYPSYDDNSPKHHAGNFEFQGTAYIKIKGFKFRGLNSGNNYPIAAISTYANANNIIIDGNSFINLDGFSVWKGGFPEDGQFYGAKNLTFTHNYIEYSNYYDAHTPGDYNEIISFDHVDVADVSYNHFYKVIGIAIDFKPADNSTISYNRIEYSRDYTASNSWKNYLGQAVYVGGWLSPGHDMKVFNNLVINGDSIGVGSECGGLTSNIYFYNNIMIGGYQGFNIPYWQSSYCPTLTESHYENIWFYNNLMVDSGWRSFDTQDNQQTTLFFRNNIKYGTGNNNFGSNVIQSNNSWQIPGFDPKFVNPSANDFHLQAGSSAIDAGFDASALFNFDFDGNTRPVGSAFDIGAYEYCTGLDCVIAPIPPPSDCSPSTGCSGACPDTPGTACNDGNPCTSGETCQSGGTCGNGTYVTCPNSNPCQSVSCNPNNNGACDIIANQPGSCNADNDLCTVGDYCLDGECQSGFKRDCSGNVCTDNKCNPDTGHCNPTNNNNHCDNIGLCDQADTGKCSNGLCRGTPKICASNKACTYGSCDPDTGACSYADVCGGLVPCGRLVDNPDTKEIIESAPCNLCSLFYMIKSLINFAAQLSFALAVLALVIAGYFYSTSAGDNRKVDLAKSVIYYTIIGILIIFLAWLAIAVILKALGYADIGVWNQVNCALK